MTLPVCIFLLFVLPYTWWPFVVLVMVWYVMKSRSTLLPGMFANLFATDENHASNKQQPVWSIIQQTLRAHDYTHLVLYPNISQSLQIPHTLKYIHRDRMLKKQCTVLWNSAHMYDIHGCMSVVILLENFLRIHFHTMMEFYTVEPHVQALYDSIQSIHAEFETIMISCPQEVHTRLGMCRRHIIQCLVNYMHVMENKFAATHRHLFAFTCY